MVYKELLESVSFSEIEPWLYKMYPSLKSSMGWMKVHYDMLRMIGSKSHTNLICTKQVFKETGGNILRSI